MASMVTLRFAMGLEQGFVTLFHIRPLRNFVMLKQCVLWEKTCYHLEHLFQTCFALLFLSESRFNFRILVEIFVVIDYWRLKLVLRARI